MTNRRIFLKILAASPVLLWLSWRTLKAKPGEAATTSDANTKIKLYSAEKKTYVMADRVIRSETEWQKMLTAEQFTVLRRKGTERAFTGEFWHNRDKGVYKCAGCANDLFSSDTKFDSGTGWPSFWSPIAPENVKSESDHNFFMDRTEVLCARCDGHLGHVFNDGPKPTGLRYCINSVSLRFIKTA